MTLFDAQVAVDPVTNQLVKDGALQVFAEGDVEFTKPLAVTDLNGLTIQNVSTSPTGMAQGFNTVEDHLVVVAKSGPHTITLRSAKGTAQEAAKEATQEAKGYRDEVQAVLEQVGPRVTEEVATNPSIKTTIGTEVDKAARDKVPPLVTDALSKDGTIRDTAQAAVGDAVEGLDLLPRSVAAATLVTKRKTIHGGQFPAPVRVSTLTVADAWPNPRAPFESIVWAENNGATLYGLGVDGMLRKSTDYGRTWERRAYLNWAPALQGTFLKTPAGTLLTINGSGNIYRSTDDGATWTNIAPIQTGQTALGTQSWCVDPRNGHVYLGMYGGTGQAVMNLYRSTDDGQTWPVFHAFPAGASSDPDKIIHIHAVVWDPVANRAIISTGDSSPGTGLYRTTADGTGVEPLVLNRMLPADMFDAPRSIGVIPFPDYLVWASDSTTNPWLFRMARTEIGKANPTVERVYRLNSTAWWTCRASNDGSRWVLSASQENVATGIDRLVHLYAIEDQGATIYEVGTLAPFTDTAPAGSMMPVGQAEIHGETLLMVSRTAGRAASWRFRMGAGGGTAIPWPTTPQQVPAWRTVNSGNVTVPAKSSLVFHVDRAPAKMTTLHIQEDTIATLTGPATTGRVELRPASGSYFHRGQSVSSRYTTHQEQAGSIYSYPRTAGEQVEFVVTNTSDEPITAVGSVTFGWGL